MRGGHTATLLGASADLCGGPVGVAYGAGGTREASVNARSIWANERVEGKRRVVRRDRREARRHPSRWAGPPPLLLLATVLGFLVAPLSTTTPRTSRRRGPRSSASRPPRARSSPGSCGPGAAVHPGRPGQHGVKPLRLAPLDVGVASMNMFRQLSSAHALQDARKLTSRPGVDVVGWQEAEGFGGVLHRPAWLRDQDVPLRRRQLRARDLLAQLEVPPGRGGPEAGGVRRQLCEGRYPFGNRLVAQVTLQAGVRPAADRDQRAPAAEDRGLRRTTPATGPTRRTRSERATSCSGSRRSGARRKGAG